MATTDPAFTGFDRFLDLMALKLNKELRAKDSVQGAEDIF